MAKKLQGDRDALALQRAQFEEFKSKATSELEIHIITLREKFNWNHSAPHNSKLQGEIDALKLRIAQLKEQISQAEIDLINE